MVDVELNKKLAEFIENQLVPAYQAKLNKVYDMNHYLDGLKNDGLCGAHAWNNLATILVAAQVCLGLQCQNFINYCTNLGKGGLRSLTS